MSLSLYIRSAFGWAVRALNRLDTALVAFARPFGVNILNPSRRYGLFLGVYAALYAVALLPFPALSLAALAVGYVGVLAVGRAWVNNEKYRSDIVKKLFDDDPDKLPDLRGLALLSAVQLVTLFPLIFSNFQSTFRLYDAPPDTTFWGWFGFTFDSFCKALLLDWMEIYERNFTDIGYASPWGRHLAFVKRLTFDFILIQGIIRLWAIRTSIREAIQALCTDVDISRRVGRRAVKPLILALEDQDEHRRHSAADALGRIGDPRAVEPLIQSLRRESYRPPAIQALEKLCDARAVETFIEALRDEDEFVRRHAAQALGNIGDARAVEPLIQALHDKNVYSPDVIEALGKIGDSRAVEVLLPALAENNHVQVRQAAAKALGKIGDPRAVEALIGVVAEAEYDADETLWPGMLGPVFFDAAEALGKIGDPRAIDCLIGALRDDNYFFRLTAAIALGDIGNARAVEPLVESLKDEKEEVRRYAAKALGEIGDPRAVEPLIQALVDDNKFVRQNAAEALGKIGDPRAVELLSQALGDNDNHVRSAAAAALGKIGDPRAVEPLIRATQDQEEHVGRDAAEALGKIDDPRAVEVTSILVELHSPILLACSGPDLPIADNVHFSVTSVRRMAPSGCYVVNVWAHLQSHINQVLQRAKMVDENAALLGTRGSVSLAHGALLSVRLHIDDLVIDKPDDILLWKGEIANAMFPVSVPKEVAPGSRRGVASVRAEGLEIVRLLFVIDISDESAEVDLLPTKTFRHARAFASYAHQDRDAVLARIHGMKKVAPSLEVFLDAVSLRSGQKWKERLREEIVARDVFYLFWSTAASRSEWVNWEWRCALAEKGLDCIDPVPIERQPPRPDPPKELATLHFDDPELHFMSNG